MKTKLILNAMMILCFAALAVSAQEKMTNFAGTWKLDTGISNLDKNDRVESITMKVAQTDRDLTIERNIKRSPTAQGAMRGAMGRGGGMFSSGEEKQTATYSLDGQETKSKINAGRFGGEKKFKAEKDKTGKLALVETIKFGTDENAREVKTIDTWELQDNGKTLKVTRELKTPGGDSQTSEMYFVRQNG